MRSFLNAESLIMELWQVNHIFYYDLQKMDKNRDGVVTLDEFILSCQEVSVIPFNPPFSIPFPVGSQFFVCTALYCSHRSLSHAKPQAMLLSE